ncbi:hypothetical protein [Sphingomonas sp.]|uniref:hypothetical protein n=1 Tax=Sphingomonas sp. TaxID=28214 RepID=UPI00286CC935|nr:hypothetical protein [Sphingomonas sp.]
MRSLLAALISLVPVAAAAAPAPARDFSIATVAPGAWTYQALPGASEARFVDSGGIARLVIRCTKASRQVSFSPMTAVAAASIFVWTSSMSRNIAVRFDAKAMRVTADFSAFDPLLDAIAFSRGRVAVGLAGGASLVVPAWPEAARTIEDCRI